MNLYLVPISILIFVCMNIQTYAQTENSPMPPQNVRGYGYEKHFDIIWDKSTDPSIVSYKVYRKYNGQFVFPVTVPKEKNYYSAFPGVTGLTYTYRVSCVNSSGVESDLSDSIIVVTHTMTDEEFLDMVQRATFRYFWDYAHPTSGLSRERLNSDNTVTIGGSGFGIMTIPIGIERGFITRQEGVERVLKIVNFLKNKAERFHGVWSHWLHGETGQVIPFSQYDNGGDLVETSFMIQGLLTVRQFFNLDTPDEIAIRDIITTLWHEVEWNWYRRYPSGSFLYWHWSPNFGWQMNMIIRGPNETHIAYLLALASPTHQVPETIYSQGWASSPYYLNGKYFYGIPLYVGWDNGGPLFFAHYSYLGFDPRNKKDAYTNYFNNNKHHTLINRAYCIANPRGHSGYSDSLWGLTASDDPFGYRVHEPFNDNGTITPSAALSSFPYTPELSMRVLKNLYRTYGSSIWGEYGFKDALNPKENWFASSYLAIDQGPIIIMIENHRTQLLWNLFMSNPEIDSMLSRVGFVYDSTVDIKEQNEIAIDFSLKGNYPNPFNPSTKIVFALDSPDEVEVVIYDVLGKKVKDLSSEYLSKGEHSIEWRGLDNANNNVPSGIYIYQIKTSQKSLFGKMVLQK
ncbi:MAG: T9SS type A sorting domain-containing protein [Ignavibacteriaceae bacterium]|nr:T9SS type A sorting domain-containing protein [Ignavibacteriaceae bacterium]